MGRSADLSRPSWHFYFYFGFICIPGHVTTTKTGRPWPYRRGEDNNGGIMYATRCVQVAQVPYQRRLAGIELVDVASGRVAKDNYWSITLYCRPSTIRRCLGPT